jgi:hypothetical protein
MNKDPTEPYSNHPKHTRLIHLADPSFWIPAVLINYAKYFAILHHLGLALSMGVAI